MGKEVVPLPYTPEGVIKVKEVPVIHWRQNPRQLFNRKLLGEVLTRKVNAIPAEAVAFFPGLALMLPGGIIGYNVGHATYNIGFFFIGLVGPMIATPILAMPLGFRQRRFKRMLSKNYSTTLSNWINDRYGLHTSPKEFEGNWAAWLSAPERKDGEYCTFDDGGKTFKLIIHGTALYVEESATAQVQDYKPTLETAAVEAEVKEATDSETDEPTPTVKAFTGENAMLASRIISRIELLQTRDMSIEQTHVVKRVREDLHNAYQLQAELDLLGGASEHTQQAITDTLADLGAELDGVLAQERDAIEQQVLAQQRYVRERKQRATNPALVLDTLPGIPQEKDKAQIR